jgi:hypothetical protein
MDQGGYLPVGEEKVIVTASPDSLQQCASLTNICIL